MRLLIGLNQPHYVFLLFETCLIFILFENKTFTFYCGCGSYLIMSSSLLRNACWIQCRLWMHFQHSGWDNGKWSVFCSLKRCLYVNYLPWSRTWQIGGSFFPRWDPLFITFVSILFIHCSPLRFTCWKLLFFEKQKIMISVDGTPHVCNFLLTFILLTCGNRC